VPAVTSKINGISQKTGYPMIMHPNLSFTRLFSISIPAVMLVVTLILYIVLFRPFILDRIRAYEEEKIDIFAHTVLHNLERSLARLVEDFNESGKLATALDVNERESLLANLDRYDPWFINIILVSKNGRIVGMSSPDNNPALYTDQDLLVRPLETGSIYISPDPVLTESGEITFAVGVPTCDRDCVMIGMLTPTKLQALVNDSIHDPLSQAWHIILVSRRGSVLFHSHLDLEELDIKQRDYSDHPAVMHALSGNWGLQKIDIDDLPWYVSSHFAPLTDWALIIQVPAGELSRQADAIGIPQTIFLAALVLLYFILMIFSVNLLVKPIETITTALVQFGENRTLTVLPRQGPGEIGAAFNAFRTMVRDRRELERAVLDAGEIERKRIGMDLHDELGQILTGIAFQNMMIQQELEEADNPTASLAAENAEMISNAISKTRHIARGLYPVHMVENGFEFAVRELATGTTHLYPLECLCAFEGDPDLDDETAIQCYHIIQEAVNNAVKHSNPTVIKITVSNGQDKWRIEIWNNGGGISDSSTDGSGIKFMRYRAGSIGADFSIESSDDCTTVIVTSHKESDQL
jgi:signal transduction histidine kinase